MLTRICNLYMKFLHLMMVVLGMTLLFAVGMQVAGRYIPFVPNYLWPLEVSRFSLIWLIFLGSVVGLREKRHFFVDVFQNASPTGVFITFLKVLYYVVLLTVTYVFVRYGYRYFAQWGAIQTSEITNVNLGFLYASVPVAGWSWLLYLVEGIWNDFFRKKDGVQ